MYQGKAFCPGCKNDVVFESIDNGFRRCPVCGFQFELGRASPPEVHRTKSAVEDFFTVLLKVILVMAAIVVVGVAVLFAGCALMMGGMH